MNSILIFSNCKSEPTETIECDGFFLYRKADGDFAIHYSVFGDNELEDFVYSPTDDVYMIEVI